MDPATAPFVSSIVSVLAFGVLLPAVVVAGILGSRALKLRERALVIRERELELEHEKLSYSKVLEAREAIERAGSLTAPREGS